jgi:hypothetical protein
VRNRRSPNFRSLCNATLLWIYRLLVFPEDNHPIDKPASEAEHWVAIADWLATHV